MSEAGKQARKNPRASEREWWQVAAFFLSCSCQWLFDMFIFFPAGIAARWYHLHTVMTVGYAMYNFLFDWEPRTLYCRKWQRHGHTYDRGETAGRGSLFTRCNRPVLEWSRRLPVFQVGKPQLSCRGRGCSHYNDNRLLVKATVHEYILTSAGLTAR